MRPLSESYVNTIPLRNFGNPYKTIINVNGNKNGIRKWTFQV